MDPRAWRRFRKNKGATVGAVMVLLVLLITIIGPFLAPHDPDYQFPDAFLANGAPKGIGDSPRFRLGADSVGRDDLRACSTAAASPCRWPSSRRGWRCSSAS